jgi:LPXTG-site transpeptidase (sortase) family protein
MEKSPRDRWRPVLWVLLCGGLLTAMWPLGQAALGWWGQRQMQQQWDAAAAQTAWEDTEEPQQPVAPQQTATPEPSAKSASTKPKTAHSPALRKRWQPLRLIISDIGLDAMVVRGVSDKALKRGPGYDTLSDWPGEPGNCVIAAHRNAYGWWFYKLGQLGSGSLIEVRTPHHAYQYEVASTQVLPETASWVLERPRQQDAAPRLTLYTCALPHGENRIVVIANLVSSVAL